MDMRATLWDAKDGAIDMPVSERSASSACLRALRPRSCSRAAVHVRHAPASSGAMWMQPVYNR